jgi:cell wall-associated NlpC family hydrolase
MPTAQTSFNPAALSSSDQQLVNYAQQAGFKGSELPTALAIIKAESGGNPNAINTANRNGTTDTGLFQINSVHSNWTKGMNLYDPLQNAKAAYKIYTDAGKSWSPWSTYNSGAYVKYLPKNTTTTVPLSNQVASNFAGSIRQIAVDKARSVIGTPYVFGGTNLQSGVDCSGLVQQIYGQLGVALPRTADDQAKSAIGTRTSVANLKPGDLVAWQGGYRGPSYVGHIAIYAGNGQIIEAPDFGLRVRQRALRPNESVFGVHLNFAGG